MPLTRPGHKNNNFIFESFHLAILEYAISLGQSTEGLKDDTDREQTQFRRFFGGKPSKSKFSKAVTS